MAIETAVIDEIETETDEVEMTTCDGCECEITQEQYDANDIAGLCPACLAKTFVCCECEQRAHQDDEHRAVKGHCESCGDAKVLDRHQKAVEKAVEKFDELAGELSGLDDLAALDATADVVKAAIVALRKIKRAAEKRAE